MNIVKVGNLKGNFSGFRDRSTLFEFVDGRRWRQNESTYYYHYAYYPEAVIVEERGMYYLKVSGIAGKLEVVKVS